MTQDEAREIANQFGSRMCDENGETHGEELYCFSLEDIIEIKKALAQRKPLINGEIYTAYITATNQTLRAQDERLAFAFARAIEAAHGIKENT